MSYPEVLGTVLGILGVWLMIRQNVWGWPVGIVQVSLYAWVFYETKLYSDALLQVFFFAIQAYGWWHWLRGNTPRAAASAPGSVAYPDYRIHAMQDDPDRASPAAASAAHPALPVTRLRPQAILGWIVAGAAVTAGWGEMMRRHTDAALPHWDAFILVFSLIAQWLQARKRLECWAGWMIVNVVAIGVYWAKDLRLTAGLYGVFFVMAAAGHVAWRKTMETNAGTRVHD